MGFLKDLGQSSAASGAGGLISGGLGQLFGGMSARRNWKYKQKEMNLAQKYNERNMQIQNQYAIDAFNRENEYNDPSAVATRYKQAGINPLAALGGGAASGAGIAGSLSVPDSDSPSASGGSDSPAFSPVQTLAEMMNARNQRELNKKQQDLLDAQARETNARADAQENENSIFDLVKSLRQVELKSRQANAERDEIIRDWEQARQIQDEQLRLSKLDEIKQRIENLQSENENIKADTILKGEQSKTEVSKRDNLQADTSLKGEQSKTESELRGDRKEVLRAGIRKTLAAAGLDETRVDREKYENFLRFINQDDSKSLYEFVSKALRGLAGAIRGDLSDYQKRLISDYLEKIWSDQKP